MTKQENYLSVTEPHLYEHVADLLVARLSCNMERRAFILALHLEVWVYAIHWSAEEKKKKKLL